MNINRLKVNRLTNPLGFEMNSLSFSWTVEETDAKKQQWARVEVAADESFQRLLWDSGEDAGLSSVDCPVTLDLQPRTRYWWRVTVQGDNGEQATSAAAWFETSKMGEKWAGKWIAPSLESSVHPLLRRSFFLEGEPVRARVYAVGLGLYELYANGEKAGDEYLAPGCTAYDRWLQYQTYDVTGLLHQGQNTLGAMLGNGWAKGRFGFGGIPASYETGEKGFPAEAFAEQFLLRLELRVLLADGREVVLGTDDTWQCAPSPVTFSSIYDGERYEQAREIPHWADPEGDGASWLPVEEVTPSLPLAEPSPRLSLPVRRKEEFHPALLHTKKDEWVLDMGQVITGGFALRANLPQGTELRLQFGELLQDGCFYRDNMRSALCEYRYISDGRPAVVRPYFTFYGYRYIKVTGWPGGKPDASAFLGYSLYSDLEEIGFLETGSEKVNRLILNAKWSQKDNFVDVPTDCPQRDERMGWTGDAQVFSSTACFVMDCAAFYDKYCRDMWKEQEIRGGSVPHVAPVIARPGGDFNIIREQGACGWADAAAIVPWNSYIYNGGKEKLREHYPAMKAWLEWVRGEDAAAGSTRLWQAMKFHYGDWLALDGPRYGMDPETVWGGTDVTFLCSVYYYRCAQILAGAAKALGYSAEQQEYGQLAREIKAAIQKEFFTATGRCAAATQTGLVLSLMYGLVPEGYEEKNRQALKSLLEGAEMHLKTGFLGTPVLCRALSKCGDSETAYTLLLQEDLPSWLYEVNMGATTIWERWNAVLPDGVISGIGMNSMNHYAYGSIVEWMYRNMCGINPTEEAPGFKRVRLAPEPDSRLGRAKATVNSPAGLYESGWQYEEDGSLTYTFAVPFDGEGALVLPNADLEQLTINGVPAKAADVAAQQDGTAVKAVLPAGRYVVRQAL